MHHAPLDTTAQNGYDSGTTNLSGGYPHPLSCVFLCPVHNHLYVYDGLREPNTTPCLGNKLRRPDTVVDTCRPMPTKLCATSTPTKYLEKAMNTLMFNGVTLTPISYNSQIYLTASELAKALGYARSDYISTIYNRNADEFSSEMTLTVRLSVKGFGNGNSEKEQRIFSLRGCHLIAMFARTPVAKEFRKWVLDILDHEVGEPILPPTQPKPTQSPTLSTADYDTVKQAIHYISMDMCFSNTSTNAIYARLRVLCGVESVCHLRYEHLPIIQNELYRIERILAPYKKMRMATEKQLIRRICSEDNLAISQAILDIEKTAHDYARTGDKRLSATIQIARIASLNGGV